MSSDALMRCDACHREQGPWAAMYLGVRCPACGVGFLRLATGEAGGAPSEGHAGLPIRGVTLEAATNFGLVIVLAREGGHLHCQHL